MSEIKLDWNAIRPLSGAREKGFEELCAQLARSESPNGSKFIRKGTPDGGVECYTIFENGSEWGWQSKYFDAIGKTQWSQIDESVKQALEKHPKIVRYYICVPWDLPDARTKDNKSAKEKWDDHVGKWTSWATERGMQVEFVYWGSHEMLERLADPKHIGRVRFWFGVQGFDGVWFSKRLDEAIRTAGPRYTPEIHVNLPIAYKFEAFGRSERFFDTIKGLAIGIRGKFHRCWRINQDSSNIEGLHALYVSLDTRIRAILEALGGIEVCPVGSLPFNGIANHIIDAESVIDSLEKLIFEQEKNFENGKESAEKGSSQERFRKENPYKDMRFLLLDLRSELRSACDDLTQAEQFAGASIMLVCGDAGTGKTHLFCDVAAKRLQELRPTVLLLGQRFVSHDTPWMQTLQQLDLANLSAEEFVGALESAAQAANVRALLLVDAVNEGSGRFVWPNHMSAFLAQLERSPWIGTVLSVRSSYQETLIPKDVAKRAIEVVHQGFMEHEYDATRTFFLHYGLELPSTPLLAPEFRNPLFLKTLCSGLHAQGERRLPRGFQGITTVFNLYLTAINERLAGILDFDRRMPLVQRALKAFAMKLVDTGTNWLSLEQAAETVNDLLPSREFERSLYRALVVEGLLVEDAPFTRVAGSEEIVFIGYERFADHLVAQTLLDRHLDTKNPETSFASGGGLDFLSDERNYVAPGRLEALFIQVAERTGQEIVTFNPAIGKRRGAIDAFLKSIVWRSFSAFNSETHELIDCLIRSNSNRNNTLESLLTVATLPGHPLNVEFLEGLLRKETMPDRDAWWSIYLHNAWDTHCAIDRLVDWASMVPTNIAIDEDCLDLCSVTLAWMLSTSNRYLRDRASKALLTLFLGRVQAMIRLVERFADVDDPYILERILAVTYGVATACSNSDELGLLANCVFYRFFAHSTPAHILLRDYARGTIERAIFVGSKIEFDVGLIRPPYKSEWPVIPSEEELKPFLADWSRGSYDDRETEWSRNIISSSVMSGDFARYVIGTNSSALSRNWLSLRLCDPLWNPPPSAEILQAQLVSEFSDEERRHWESFEAAEKEFEEIEQLEFQSWFSHHKEQEAFSILEAENQIVEFEKNRPANVLEAEAKAAKALEALEGALTPDHLKTLIEIRRSIEEGDKARKPPRFDLRIVQRYIVRRVFDLGWTLERFGFFDRFSVRIRGRESAKAERIGKKYQWIAYHEIMALISDHFQYYDYYRENEGAQIYDGPWQSHFRDIDPSCTLRDTQGGTSWGPHTPAWWGAQKFNNWKVPEDSDEWTAFIEDFPNIRDLLFVEKVDDQSRWINAFGSFSWKQDIPPDKESSDVEQREIWLSCVGYLLRADDVEAFVKWAEESNIEEDWPPEVAKFHQIFLGEYGWSRAYRHFQKDYYGEIGWNKPSDECPAILRVAAAEYQSESGGFDCSIDKGFSLRVPIEDLLVGMKLTWNGRGAEFVNDEGRLTAFDPTAISDGPSALLLGEEGLRSYLDKAGLTLCWFVSGEKRVLPAGIHSGHYHEPLSISGVIALGKEEPFGFLKFSIDKEGIKSGRIVSTKHI